MESRRIPALSHVSKANIFMTSGPEKSINPLVADVGSPPIPEAQAWTKRYDGAFGPLINLSQAVPGNAPHAELPRANGRHRRRCRGLAIRADQRRCASPAGLCGRAFRIYEGRIGPEDTAVTAGCNMAFFVAMMLLAHRGDAVLLPTPWYFNHQMSLDMLGIEPRPLPCRADAGFVPRVEDAEALIDDKVRAIVLVTPNNPTGAVYPAHVIESFAQLCRKRGIYLVIDETYRDFLPQGMNRPHGLFVGEEWRDTVIQLYSFSKSYAIPGHRTGAIAADAGLIEQAAKILDCIQICAPRTAQGALPWAIDGLRDWREANRAEINGRAQVFQDALAPLPEWKIESVGAYFAYLRHPFPGRQAQQVAEKLARSVACCACPEAISAPVRRGICGSQSPMSARTF